MFIKCAWKFVVATCIAIFRKQTVILKFMLLENSACVLISRHKVRCERCKIYIHTFFLTVYSNRKCLLDLYKNEVQLANVLCDITNIPKSTVYDNLNTI